MGGSCHKTRAPTATTAATATRENTMALRIIRRVLGTAVRGTVLVSAFGLGLGLCARPWPDSPFWTKPMALVPDKNTVKLTPAQSNSQLTQLDAFIGSKLYQTYINDPKFTLMSMDKLIPEAHKYNQVSQGLLNLQNPVILINREAGELVLFGHADNSDLIGSDGKIHNGIVLTLMDEALCFCGFDKLPSKRGVTANLNVDFNNKIHPGSTFVLSAKVQEARGRKVLIRGTLDSLKGESIADAKCLLVEPRWFKWLSWVELF